MPEQTARPPVTGDNAPAEIRDHPFQPPTRQRWWGLCQRCNLAASAHAKTTVDLSAEARRWR